MFNKLGKKLKNTFYTGLIAGALSLGYFGGCKDLGTEPPKTTPPLNPKFSQTLTLENYVNIKYEANLENVNTAERKTFYNGNLTDTKTINSSPYSEILSNKSKGQYAFILEAQNAKADTARLEVPNYMPEANFGSLQTNMYPNSQKIFSLEWLLTDKNPEDTVALKSATSLDGKTQVSINGYELTINSLASLGLYEILVGFGSLVGGLEQKVLSGQILEVPIVPDKIAFWSNKDAGSGELYIAELVGDSSLTNEKRLTNNGVNDVYPYFSPDGSKIVWSANRATADGWFALYVMNANGSGEYRLTPSIPNFSAYSPFWSKDNKIYFNYVDRDSSQQGIAMINPEGTGFEKIIMESLTTSLSGRPSASADGSIVAFSTIRDGNYEIYTTYPTGTNLENITNHSSLDISPLFSFNGEEIFFGSDRNGSRNIFSVNLQNKMVRQITNGSEGYDNNYDLSRDGKKIIFMSERDGWYHLYLQDLENGKVTRLTFDGVQGDGTPVAYQQPAFSPKH